MHLRHANDFTMVAFVDELSKIASAQAGYIAASNELRRAKGIAGIRGHMGAFGLGGGNYHMVRAAEKRLRAAKDAVKGSRAAALEQASYSSDPASRKAAMDEIARLKNIRSRTTISPTPTAAKRGIMLPAAAGATAGVAGTAYAANAWNNRNNQQGY